MEVQECCSFCNASNAFLQHIFAGCYISLFQEHYRWRHNQVLRKLAEVQEGCRQGCKESPAENHTSFATEGGRPREQWDIRNYLNRQLWFPTAITTTSLLSDIVVWCIKMT